MKRWAVVNNNGVPLTVKIKTGLGIESMKYFANKEAAETALSMMFAEDVIKHGAHVAEVTPS